MTMVAAGNKVQIHYTGRLDDGTVFDSSEGREPLEFEVGAGVVIPGFDAGVVGMGVDEEKTITIAPEDAYGPRMDNLMIEVPRESLPDEIAPEVGLGLEMSNDTGQRIPVTIAAVTEETVTMDANHPLAGQALTFDLKVVAIT